MQKANSNEISKAKTNEIKDPVVLQHNVASYTTAKTSNSSLLEPPTAKMFNWNWKKETPNDEKNDEEL